jgi:DNA-binding response OmpR family regulator
LGLGRTHDRLASFIFRASPRTVSREAILSGSWGVDGERRTLGTLRAQLSKMRSNLAAYGISIVSDHRFGYHMPAESAEIVKALLAREAENPHA